jgi:iron(III) transport system substrate-binding protein
MTTCQSRTRSWRFGQAEPMQVGFVSTDRHFSGEIRGGHTRGTLPTVSVAFVALLLATAGCRQGAGTVPPERASTEVAVYTSLDRPYAEPVLRAFERQSHIQVRDVYDAEATKSVGLAARLVAERARPRADVFWSSEAVRMIGLKQQGVLAPYRSPSAADIPARFRDPDGFWTGFAGRPRIIVYNKQRVTHPPLSVFDLERPPWRDELAVAKPWVGTAATEAAALAQLVGRPRMEAHYRALQANGVRVVDGNSVAADLAARGDVKVAVTDLDDAFVRIDDGKPLGIVYPDQKGIGMLLTPDTVALVKGGPHPDAGRRLIDYLLSRPVEAVLARSRSRQIPLRPGIPGPPGVPPLRSLHVMALNLPLLARDQEATDRFLRALFLR